MDRESRNPLPTTEELDRLRQRVRELEQRDAERTRIEHSLGERVKELACLYGVSEINDRFGTDLPMVMQAIVDLLPRSWQFPEISCARIELGSDEWVSADFERSPWAQTSAILVAGLPSGAVEVYYREDRPPSAEGPFLEEERLLINAVSLRIGVLVQRIRTEQQLEMERASLRRMNIALREVLSRVETEKRAVGHAVQAHVDKIIIPILHALERGVYNHVPDDGRELVVADPSAVKIRAEDGRYVEGVDIRPFIAYLPGGGTPERFHTLNASGSTSQAANIMEALEVGTRVLLLDEDTCATNLMIRDARMQALVEKSGEPITPFLDRVRQLADQRGVSSILVLGGSGDYFDVADTVIRMDTFVPADVTAQAKAVAAAAPSGRAVETEGTWPCTLTPRVPDPASLDPRKGRRDVSIKSRALRAVQYGTEEIELDDVAQLVDEGQVRAIGKAMELARQQFMDGQRDLPAVIDAVMDTVDRAGLDALDDRPGGDFAAFRAYELAAAINRLRTLRMKS